MGHLAQSPVANRAGLALPSSLLALTAISVLVAGMFTLTDLNARATRNRERAARAMQIAEAGAAHALGVLRRELSSISHTRLLKGNDSSTSANADDGYLMNYAGLAAAEQIRDTGRTVTGGRYFVRMFDDPADPSVSLRDDANYQILARCRGETLDGAVAEVEAVLAVTPSPGIAVNGNLGISSAAAIQGACGGAHANGNMTGGGNPTAATQWSATGSIAGGYNGTQQPNAPPMELPTLNPGDYCSSYVAGGTISSVPAAGLYCYSGNVKIDFDGPATPRAVTIIATGSIEISKKPNLRSFHPDGILLLAGGAVDFDGDWIGQGMVYSGGDCVISGKMNLTGQLLCKGRQQPDRRPGDDHVRMLRGVLEAPRGRLVPAPRRLTLRR